MGSMICKAVGAFVGVVLSVATLSTTPALAGESCEIVLTATVNGVETSGALPLTVTASSHGWAYTPSIPRGYDLKWLDGTFAIEEISDGSSIAGGVLTRSRSISGEFTIVSACFARRSQTTIASGHIPL